MIKAENLTKQFDNIMALDHVSAEIKDGNVFGLIGTNGAGKSTFLRLLSGILKPDEGTVTIDGESVFENENVKKRFFYISDDQYYFNNATPQDMMEFYSKVYPEFDRKRFESLIGNFGLEMRRKVHTFSKGMKKQLSVACGISANTDYLFCDETFDGLDPVMRQAVKSIFANDMAERNLTPIIASHNLRELEDICDHVGLLHRGGDSCFSDVFLLTTGYHRYGNWRIFETGGIHSQYSFSTKAFNGISEWHYYLFADCFIHCDGSYKFFLSSLQTKG